MLKEIEHACKLLTAEEVCNYLEPVAPEQGDTADMWEALYVTFRDPKKSTHVEIKIHAVHLAASLGSTCVLQWLVDHCSPDVLCYQSIMGTVNERTKAVTDSRTLLDSFGLFYFTFYFLILLFSLHFLLVCFAGPCSVVKIHDEQSLVWHSAVPFSSWALNITTCFFVNNAKGCREHYTPLMSALFMSNFAAALWDSTGAFFFRESSQLDIDLQVQKLALAK